MGKFCPENRSFPGGLGCDQLLYRNDSKESTKSGRVEEDTVTIAAGRLKET